MPVRCCGTGPQGRARLILDGLTAAGIPLPPAAQVHGPIPGECAWHVVDGYGREPDPPVRSTVSARWVDASVADAVHRFHQTARKH